MPRGAGGKKKRKKKCRGSWCASFRYNIPERIYATKKSHRTHGIFPITLPTLV
jgi:hypothetical protein